MEDIFVRLKDLPYGMNAVTILDEDGDYNVYVNARLSYDGQLQAQRHEWCISKETIFIIAFQSKKQRIYSRG